MKETRFKETEIGLFPEDWKDATIQDLGPISKGKGISRAECGTGNIPCVRYGEIYKDYDNYIKSFQSFISKEVAKTSRKLQYGELLFTGSGETKEDIGKCVAFVGNEEAYAGGDIIIVNPNLEDNNPLFLGFLMNDKYIISQKALRGQGDAVVHITSKTLATVQMVLPPLDEQTRIASALTSIDNLISSLDKLIEKKKNIKQGTMQQLLTGKKRLNGFNEPWVEKKLGEIAKIETGKKDVNIASQTGLYPFFTCSREVYRAHSYSFDTDAILIAGNGDVGNLHEYHGKFEVYQRTYVLYEFKDVILKYIIHYLSMYLVKKLLEGILGSTIPYIVLSQLQNFVINCPIDENEQIAIASVLTSMDNAISALEAKKAKYEQIKQGMMQQLLTGKIRLV